MSLLTLTELACVNVVATASLSASLGLTIGNGIYAGLGNADILASEDQTEAIVCWAETHEQEVCYKSNVFPVIVNIFVKEMAPDVPVATSVAATIFNAFLDRENIGNNLTQAVPNYLVFSVVPSGGRAEVEGDANVQTLQLKIVCCTT